MRDHDERVVEIRVTKSVIMAVVGGLSFLLLPLLLTLSDQPVEADSSTATTLQTTGLRSFYLSQTGAPGSQASTKCAAGYHMASLWEIADPSNLSYNTALGMTSVDSGSGPSTEYAGWVRTGYASNDSAVAGRANCLGWISAGAGDYGTAARLPDNWTGGAEDLGVWDVGAYFCSSYYPVWCIEDSP